MEVINTKRTYEFKEGKYRIVLKYYPEAKRFDIIPYNGYVKNHFGFINQKNGEMTKEIIKLITVANRFADNLITNDL